MLIYIVKITLKKGKLEKQLKVIWIIFRLLKISSLFYLKKGVKYETKKGKEKTTQKEENESNL